MNRRVYKTLSLTTSIFITLILYFPVASILVSAPEDQVALVGETIQFNCSTNEIYSIVWQHIPFQSQSIKDVYISRTVVLPYYPRFTVEVIELGGNVTAYNLIISAVHSEDAGTYRCVDRSGIGQQHDAQLTVIESRPKCDTNIGSNGFIGENDCGLQCEIIHCSCSLEYKGNIAPDMQWITSKAHKISTTPITNTSERSVSSELKLTASSSMNGTSIIWQSMQSTHINWTSNAIKISYAKRNHSTVILGQSEFVTCSASSSEHCSYIWIARKLPNYELETFEGQTLEVNKPGTYLCEAQCPLNQMSCTVTSLHVEYRTKNEDEHKIRLLVGLITGCICILTGLLIGLPLFIYRRRWLRRKRPGIHDDLNHQKPEELHFIAPIQ